MEFLALLVIPIVGGIIGYSTNLLAITMLFRPHREIRIFGFRLPFTPGLIPKQQRQLAQKMGASLAENILTSQSLVDAASNTGIVNNIVDMAQGFVGSITTSDKPISKILADKLNLDEITIIDRAVQNSEKLMMTLLSVARDYTENKALPYLRGEDFAQLLMDFANASLASAETSGKKLSDLIPPSAIAAIKDTTKNNVHKASPICRKFLADDRVDARLRELVSKIVKDNAGGLLGLFVNPDKIYESIVQNLLKYLDDKENHELICEKLVTFIDNTLDKEVSWLIGQLKDRQAENWLETVIKSAQKNLQQEHVDKFFDGISSSLAPQKAIEKLLALSPAQIAPSGANYSASVDKLVRNSVKMLAQKAGEHIVGALDVAKIAEERIAAFDTAEMERLVMSVVGSQLKWIMYLGGLLGFIMGFFPAIFNLLF
ncbi:MAG: DUF445 family protein [Defluviitaleaceae bacterium]|nr:DUF445 family protein [Defluviitaleaceae bacterium]